MPKKSSNDAAPAPIALDSDLRIGAAPALRDTLLTALDAARPVTLDGGAVAQVDTAALQVLAAFARDARAAGVAVTWAAASDTLRRGVGILGLNELIALPASAGAN
jgi:anti-anti-sigma regulatory factor